MKFPHLIWCNLRRKKLRTSLTFLSIAVAFVLYGLLGAIEQALVGGIQMAGADRLIVRNKVSFILSLPESYEARLDNNPEVKASTHENWFGGIYQDPKNFFGQMAVASDTFLDMYPEFLLPADQKAAWLKTRTGAIVGRKTAQRFGWKIGDKIPLQGTIYGKKDGSRIWDFDIVGIFDGAKKGTDTSAMFFHYDYFDEARVEDKSQVGWYIIRIRDPARAAEVASQIDDEFANSPAETRTEAEGAMYQGFARQMGNIVLMVTSIQSAVFLTILMVAGNTMAQSVRERTGELGVLKAIGFSSGQVMGMVLAESCLLSILGGALGLGLAWVMAAQGDPTGGMLPMFYLPAQKVAIGLGIGLVLGLVTGIFPAIQALRLRVADALRRM
jgi:putative ABC transport system permease protein